MTPFDANLKPDSKRFLKHCRWLVDNGAGLAIFGTNSEAASLSVEERLKLTDELHEAGIPAEQKAALADAFTQACVKVLGSSPDGVDILFYDIPRHNWATGGQLWNEKSQPAASC